MPSFADIHGKNPEDVRRPPPIPYGHYVAAVEGLPIKGKSSKAQTDQWQFKARLLQPQGDIDSDKLMAWKDATGESVLGQHVYLTFYDPQPWRMTEFLLHLGLRGIPYPECMSECPGRQFIVEIGHEPSQDGRSIIHTVRSTSALPK